MAIRMRMPRRKRVLRRRNLRRKPMRKALGRPRIKRQSDYARLVTTLESQILALNNAVNDSVGQCFNFCLADFQRPQEVAHAYKYYRAAKVELSFIPYYNISQVNAPGAAGTRLPQLYMSVDRQSNQLIVPTESEMLSRGVAPKVWNRKMKLTFKPNLLQEINFETAQPGDGAGNPLGIHVLGALNSTAIFDKWLPTQQGYGYSQPPPPAQTGVQVVPNAINPYAVRYHGAVYVAAIEQIAPGVPQAVGDVQVKVTWEFKGPRALVTDKPQQPLNPYVATSMTTAGVVANEQPTDYP